MDVVYSSFFKETKNLFANSNVVKYWPYIGKGYFGSSVKILVLGESHHHSDPPTKSNERTNEVVIGAYLNQMYTRSFSSFADFPKGVKFSRDSYLKGFRNTAKMIAHAGSRNSDYVWDNLAFFNFFQKPVAPCAGSHEWLDLDYNNYVNQARAAFDEVLKKLTPDIVVIWGKGKLNKQWLPANKEQIYPNVVFFPITHPSYNIRKKCINEWNYLVQQKCIAEQYADHYPYNKKIEGLFYKLRGFDCVKPFKCWFSERSIGFELYQEWNTVNKCFVQNSLITNKSTAIILIFFIDKNGEMSLEISTRHESELETQKIIDDLAFNLFHQKRNLNYDGIFELCRFGANVNDEELLSNIVKALQAVVSYRNRLV